MTGIVGFALGSERLEVGTTLADMAAALHSGNSVQADISQEGPFGYGLINLKTADSGPRSFRTDDGVLSLVMEGEIYDWQQMKSELASQGYLFRTPSAAEVVLHLFEKYGNAFAGFLNGSFTIAIWNSETHTLLLANDRLGLCPLYYCLHAGSFYFASGARALLALDGFSRQIDLGTLVQTLAFDHPLGGDTLLKDVRLLSPASLLTFRDGDLMLHEYWQIQCVQGYPMLNEDDYLPQLAQLLRQAANRFGPDHHSSGLFLSGGLDSRVLAALLAETHPSGGLNTYTWGIPGCDDARFAHEVASHLRIPNQFCELKPDWLLDKAEEGIRLTDGNSNIIHMHILAVLDAISQQDTVLYKGFFGDALMGFYHDEELIANYSGQDLLNFFIQYYDTLFNFNDLHALLSEEIRQQTIPELEDKLCSILTCTNSSLALDQFYQFDLIHRQRRFTLNGVILARSRAQVRLPYTDNDLLEFMICVPPGLRFGRNLLIHAFIEMYPTLAKIPITHDGLPLVDCIRKLKIITDRQLRWRLRAAGARWIQAPQFHPYANYAAWMRNELRDWIEAILLDQRSLSRGYFKPDEVRRLVQEHMAGANHALKLGRLISLELWQRMYVDQN